MKILYIGSQETHEQYVKGMVPSHWLYGAVEMEKEGYEVVWEQERSSIWNDYRLVRRTHPGMVFIPNLNLHNHLLILLLSAIGLFRIPIFAFLHHEPKVKKGIKAQLYRTLLAGCQHVFFLSEKTMEETIGHNLIKREKCSVPGWGADMDFYHQVEKRDGEYYVSTGKENRDFNMLIDAFERTGAPLKIMTAKSHGGNDHEWLKDRCKDIANIEVVITENSGDVFPIMLKEMAKAKALVCPLLKDKLNYCVGLSTIADAEGLGKPLIITRNSYHSKGRMEAFNTVDSLEDWIKAIDNLKHPTVWHENMKTCWESMKPYFIKRNE